MTDASVDEWFETHILPHERALMRYLKRARVNAADLVDLRQDVYVRVYKSAARSLPASPKAFLLSTARHLLVDRIRRERVVSIDYRSPLGSPLGSALDPELRDGAAQDFDASNVLIDEKSPELQLSARQELRRLSEAFDRLSQDCRAVVWLRRVEGLSQREVATRLRMQEGTVASHLCRGLRVLTNAMLGDGAEGGAADGQERPDDEGGDNETRHG